MSAHYLTITSVMSTKWFCEARPEPLSALVGVVELGGTYGGGTEVAAATEKASNPKPLTFRIAEWPGLCAFDGRILLEQAGGSVVPCDQCDLISHARCLRCSSAVCRRHARRGTWRGRVGALCSYCAEYAGIVSKNSVPAGTLAGGKPPDSPRDMLSQGTIAVCNAFGSKLHIWLMWYFGNNATDVL